MKKQNKILLVILAVAFLAFFLYRKHQIHKAEIYMKEQQRLHPEMATEQYQPADFFGNYDQPPAKK